MAAQAVIDLVRSRFANLKQYSDALSVVRHGPLRGRFREILTENLLAPYLPPTVEMLTGTILGCNGEAREARNEDDIVVFDQTWAPLLHRTRGRDAIIPITGVRAHIEVKSTLKLIDIRVALLAAAELTRMAIQTAPIGLIFAFTSEIGMDHHIPTLLLKEMKSIGCQPGEKQTTCPIQGICILGRGSWFLMGNEKINLVPGWYEVKAEQDREILAFVSIISNAMYGNDRGLGTHVLDLSWLIGPNPETPVIVPSSA